MDFIAYNKLNSLNQKGTFSTVQTAAIFQIVTIVTGNVVSFVFGIITISNLSKEEIKNYLTEGFVSKLTQMKIKNLLIIKLEEDESLALDEFRVYSKKLNKDITEEFD